MVRWAWGPDAAGSSLERISEHDALIGAPEGTVVASTDPTLLGDGLPRPAGTQPGRAWTGHAGLGGRETLAAYVPVIGNDGGVAGTAVAVWGINNAAHILGPIVLALDGAVPCHMDALVWVLACKRLLEFGDFPRRFRRRIRTTVALWNPDLDDASASAPRASRSGLTPA